MIKSHIGFEFCEGIVYAVFIAPPGYLRQILLHSLFGISHKTSKVFYTFLKICPQNGDIVLESVNHK